MQIIKNEIKKIFNYKMLLVLIVGSLLIYKLLIEGYIGYTKGVDRPFDIYDPIRVPIQIVDMYGTYIDDDEVEDFKEYYKEKVREADNFFEENEEAKRLGFNSYKEFGEIGAYEELGDNKQVLSDKILYHDLGGKEFKILLFDIRDMEIIINRLDSEDKYLKYNYPEKRIDYIYQNKVYRNVLPYGLIESYNTFIGLVFSLIILSVAFMVSRIFVDDKKNKVDNLQLTSKEGRSINKKKLISAVIATMIITTVDLFVCLSLYFSNGFEKFFSSNINSFLNTYYPFDISFGQYIIWNVITIYIVALLVCIICLSISKEADQYLFVIGLEIPIIFVIIPLICFIMPFLIKIQYGVFISIILYLIIGYLIRLIIKSILFQEEVL